MLILAFDTATNRATSALVRNGDVLGERTSKASRVLADADDLLREARVRETDVTQIAVGTGPGSFTGIRIGLAAARGLSYSLGITVAGVSTLDALAAGAPGAVPVIDARRREVFALLGGPRCLPPAELVVDPGTVCVGDGAVRYRDVLEEKGADVPPDDSPLHVPWARHHAALARDYGGAGEIEPIYLRLPDALARPAG
jgi:tRNA threonylcarbamoyl adenosine modification protein YeaZ